MSTFGGVYFTNKGRALQAKALTGIQLNFTKLVVGDGSLTGQVIADLTALVHEVKTLSITTLKNTNDGKVTIGGVLTNQGLASGFYWREIALFATDPDLGEILYCYGNAAALAEYIPAGGGADLLEKQINIVAIIGNATSVSATINNSLVYASVQDLQGKISHSLATAVNDFLVASSVGQYVKKTLAEVKTILGLGNSAYKDFGVAGGVASYDAVATSLADMSTKQGNLSTLNTTDKTSLVKAVNELFTSANNGKTAIASAVNAKGISATSADTFSVLATKIATTSLVNTADATVIASEIISGKTGYKNGAKITGTIPVAPQYPDNNSASACDIYSNLPNSRHNLFLRVPKGYYDETWMGVNLPNLVPANIKEGISIGAGGMSIVGTAIEGRKIAFGIKVSENNKPSMVNIDGNVITYCGHLIVTGLSFIPKTIIILDGQGRFVTEVSTEFDVLNNGYHIVSLQTTYIRLISPLNISYGFDLPVLTTSVTYQWIAIG